MARRKILFPYYGGKNKMVGRILPYLPTAEHGVQRYIEPFGGSAAVLLNRKPVKVEVYNDLNADLVNLFRMLRERGPELTERLRLTPYSRDEFRSSFSHSDDEIEQARRTVVRYTMIYLCRVSNKILERKCGTFGTGATSTRARAFSRRVDSLPAIVERLRPVTIENREAYQLLATYDSPEALFYCDPPYVHAARQNTDDYGTEMSDEDHRCLAKALRGLEGRVALSGFDSNLYSELYKGWHKTFWVVPSQSRSGTHGHVVHQVECLWTNYRPTEAGMPRIA